MLKLGGLFASRIEPGDERSRAALQDLLERCTDYVSLEEGAPTRPQAAAELIDALPPGRTQEHKYLLGLAWNVAGPPIAVIDVVRGFPDQTDWFVGLMLIDPAERGRGLGARIVADLEDWLRSQGASTAYLAVLERNPSAQRFWERLGYRVLDRRIRVDGDRQDPVFRMKKELGAG